MLIVAVALLGVVLTATVIPAPFTIDENNYLVSVVALQAGRLTLPATEGLPVTRELLYFDPAASQRDLRETPVASTVPPLYAPLALPFSFLGWRGLVALNTIAFAATVLLAFELTRRGTSNPEAPWIAAIAVGAGAYFLEYAQGVWPHMVTVALIAGAALCCDRAIEQSRWTWAAGAGFLAALAAGVRYQNVLILGSFGLGLLLLGRDRLRALTALTFGASIPLATSSLINWARQGSWNPISKGPGYLITTARLTAGEGSFVEKAATMAWARIVDYSAQPPLSAPEQSFLSPQPASGAYVLVTAVKKAWLQSSPWMIVPIVLMAASWLPQSLFTRMVGRTIPQRRLRLLALVVVPTLAMFSTSGVTRTDGLCFNQRYFCELVPMMAVGLAWGVQGIGAPRKALLGGGLVAAVLAFASLQLHHLAPLRHYLVEYLPLVLALLFAAAWGLWIAARARKEEKPFRTFAVAFALGSGLAWGLAIHVGDDLQASRILRHSRWDYVRQLRPYITDHSAVFASGGVKDALGLLQLDLDVVIAVPGYDHGAATKDLLDAFLAQGRRVFFLPNALPRALLDPLLEGRQVRGLGTPVVLIEVG